MFELHWMGRFRKKWKKLGEYASFDEAYSTLDAIMSGYPGKASLTFRICGATID